MSTNLHIDDIGNLILRDGKLSLFVSSQYVTPPHYGGGRVGALCPYAYCAGDPVNCVDPDGRYIFVLSAPNGAHGAGHMAMLVQETRENGKKQWYLYSKNGTDENFGIRGVSSGDNVGTGSNLSSGWDTIDDFFNDTNLNPIDENGTPEYQEGFLLKCDETKDQLAIEGAKSVLGESDNNKDYDVLNNNCAQTVQAGVSRAGFKDGSGTKGRRIAARVVGRAVGSFLGYKYGEALGDYVGQPAYEKSPNLIYKRMKEQNKVEDKDVKKMNENEKQFLSINLNTLQLLLL